MYINDFQDIVQIIENNNILQFFPPQIGQVQKSLESCMDKQTVEFQTQVWSYLQTYFAVSPFFTSFSTSVESTSIFCRWPE